MSNANTHGDAEVEAAMLDAELFLKYQAPERAIKRLRSAIEHNPRSVQLRERLREIAIGSKHPDEAARQCLALASLYIAREDFDTAHDRLLEAKQIDPRISIAAGLEAIRRARRPDLHTASHAPAAREERSATTLAGDLSVISIFDVVQVLENARLTGALTLTSDQRNALIHFNQGRIVGAEADELQGIEAFRKTVEITQGTFGFERSTQEFPVTIQTTSNTSLILDTLREMDEGKQG
ncbi:MAG: hypothetical protein AUG51_15140 [Acidobacteria bacterium 13_1_20CM_3_53_8]|nr:MAG: hypothetical protein AUG51_15140 [Acidobacteria bacterium 13_1_20CM_3_53_8]